MTIVRVKVWLNPERKPDVDEYMFTLDLATPQWSELSDYLVRLEQARIVDSWEWKWLEVQDTGDTLDFLKAQHHDDLESVEQGYEEPYSDGGGGGSSASYRRDMKDAGRGHLLP